jgi:signal transduction histidine kinase
LPTRNTLVVLFVVLVGVPVGAAAYLGAAGLARERDILVERERAALERRADRVRDALVRELQRLHRAEMGGRTAAQQIEEVQPALVHRFLVSEAGLLRNDNTFPEDIERFATSAAAQQRLKEEAPWPGFEYAGDIAYRRAGGGGGMVLVGFRIDVDRLNQRYLDPASPHAVLTYGERVADARLVRDDPRTRIHATDSRGLPQVLYRYVEPSGRAAAPVLLPPGYVLAVEVRPAAALDRDLAEAGRGLALTLAVVGVVVALGIVFFWRALRAEARLTARKTDFVNAVSHELRTPLTSIRMYADMLKEGWVKDPDTAQEYVGLMSAESERLARLVNNVLDFSRIEKGAKRFRMQIGDPAPVVRDVAEVLQPYLKEKGFELVLEVPDHLPACSFDKDALTQILVNLIDNAVKYGEKEVRVEAEAVDGAVSLRVLDRGPGISPSDRERIFRPFQRGENAKSGGGSGLGLALVHHYAEAHHGTIAVGDREGGGAVFSLRLPAA